jgi:hypothetical protein
MGGEVMVAVGESERNKMVRIAKKEGWIDSAIENGIEIGLEDPVALLVAKGKIKTLPDAMIKGNEGHIESLFRIQKRIGSPLFAVVSVPFSLLELMYEKDQTTMDRIRRSFGEIIIVLAEDGVGVCIR